MRYLLFCLTVSLIVGSIFCSYDVYTKNKNKCDNVPLEECYICGNKSYSVQCDIGGCTYVYSINSVCLNFLPFENEIDEQLFNVTNNCEDLDECEFISIATGANQILLIILYLLLGLGILLSTVLIFVLILILIWVIYLLFVPSKKTPLEENV